MVQHGQAGPTQLAPERLSELVSDWSSLTAALSLAAANLGSNWQKRALGLSARLLTAPLPLADQDPTPSSETKDHFHFKQALLHSACMTSQRR